VSACHSVRLKSALIEIRSGKHTTLQNQPAGRARQRTCSRIIALMCERTVAGRGGGGGGGGGGSEAISRRDSNTTSTLIAVPML